MKKIVIAEDDKFLANALRAKFTRVGYEVTIARDGEEALAVIESIKPDIVLLDIIMPKKDGFLVLEELRNNPKWQKLPVIIASTLNQDEDLARAKKLGANDFIVKSNTGMAEIVNRVSSLL